MKSGLSLLCEGNNAKKALENIALAKNSLSKGNHNSLQLSRLENYEAIVNFIIGYIENSKNSVNKEKISIEEISQATGFSVNYIKNNLRAISLYVLEEIKVEEQEHDRGKYACRKSSPHTIPVCRRFIKNYTIGSERG